MNEIIRTNEVVLGFHSPTEWVFFPEVVALYDRIVINRQVFEKTVSKGERSPSTYEMRKATLLKELNEKGILSPKNYPVGKRSERKLNEIVKHFFVNHETKMRRLLVHAFEAFIKHEKETLDKLIDHEDPYWNDVMSQLPRLERVKASLIEGTPLLNLPQLHSIAKRYFEDAILTPMVFKHGYNPIFQWEGYARFEEFLLSFRKGTEKQIKSIKKGAELRVLKSLSDVVLPFRFIKQKKGIRQVIDKWEAFGEIRVYIRKINDQIWKTIESYNEGRILH